MLLVFSAHRAARTPAVRDAIASRRLVDMRDAKGLRDAASSTAATEADARRCASQLGGGFIVYPSGRVRWDEGKRDAALDTATVRDETRWANARPHRDGWQRRSCHY